MAERTLLLVRHGDYSGESLNATGRRQAELTAGRLSRLAVTGFHSSTLKRAIETAEIISARLDEMAFRRSHLLKECIPSIPRRFSHLRRQVARTVLADDRERADRAWRRYFRRSRNRDRRDLIVCHGNLIRYLVSRALGLGPRGWGAMGTNHCGITEVRVTSRGETLLIRYNDVGHLPARLQTS